MAEVPPAEGAVPAPAVVLVGILISMQFWQSVVLQICFTDCMSIINKECFSRLRTLVYWKIRTCVKW
jgi:hypothetical protein